MKWHALGAPVLVLRRPAASSAMQVKQEHGGWHGATASGPCAFADICGTAGGQAGLDQLGHWGFELR